jgi:chemotaxis protein methyltransferase CheR
MISAADYQFLVGFLREQSGLALDAGKQYLVESRLTPVAACLGFPDVSALIRELRTGRSAALTKPVCEAMATHESLFFRDNVPFQVLKDHLMPQLISARRTERRLRIWSAAASTGQEPYSIAMAILNDFPALEGWNIEILATDYSEQALARARSGVYTHFEVQRGLSIQMLAKYFTRSGTDWQIAERVRRMVTFRQANLLHPFAGMGRFDLVFCRNVLIYFDVPTKCDVLNRLTQVLLPDGYLFLGSAETAVGLTDRLLRVPNAMTSVYQRVEHSADPALERVAS